MAFLRWIGYAVLALAGVIALLFVGARFADGPVAMIPGGPLKAGELVTETNVDWTFATDEAEIELQLVDPPRSRTVWVVVHERRAYVPASLDFPPLKSWHKRAVVDGRAILRVQGKRYQRRLVHVDDPELTRALAARVAEKYELGEGGSFDAERVWFFRVDPT